MCIKRTYESLIHILSSKMSVGKRDNKTKRLVEAVLFNQTGNLSLHLQKIKRNGEGVKVSDKRDTRTG